MFAWESSSWSLTLTIANKDPCRLKRTTSKEFFQQKDKLLLDVDSVVSANTCNFNHHHHAVVLTVVLKLKELERGVDSSATYSQDLQSQISPCT